ncbi:MAG: AAA family ATPase [Candidatus Woesearchaeota archaeon]
MPGKIIGIVGAPGSGKSFLVHKLAEQYHAIAFMEGEPKEFPSEIRDKLEQNECDLEVFLWFRAKLLKDMLEAQRLSHLGKTILLDTFWKVSECYLDLIEEDEERKEAARVLEEDEKLLPLPDKIILLKISEEKLRELIKKRDRSFENEEVIQTNLFLAKEYERIFTQKKFGERLIIVDRDEMDFEKEEDVKEVMKRIE